MAAIKTAYAYSDGLQTETAGTWTTVTSLASSNFASGEKWLILAATHVGTDDGSQYTETRVTHGGTAFSNDLTSASTSNVGTNYVRNQCPHLIVWEPSASEELALQFRGTGTGNQYADFGMILAIRVSELASTDFYSGEETTQDSALSDTVWADKATINIPASSLTDGEEWAVFGFVRITPGSTTQSHEFQLEHKDGGTAQAIELYGISEGEDTAEKRGYWFMKRYQIGSALDHDPANAADFTVQVKDNHSAANSTYESSVVCALRLDAFEDYGTDWTAAEYTQSVGFADEEVASTDPTVTTTPGDWIVIGGITFDSTGAHPSVRGQVTSGGSGTYVPAKVISGADAHIEAWDPTDELPWLTFARPSISSSPADFGLSVYHAAGRVYEDRSLVAFSAELAAAAPATAVKDMIGGGIIPGPR